MKIMLTLGLTAFALTATAATAGPAAMVMAKSDAILVNGPGFGTLLETRDQAGLAAGYVDEHTALHPYTAVTTHTTTFPGYEWFSEFGSTSAMVSYYVAASSRIKGIDHFVLWNEESSGIGVFDLYWGLFPGDLADLVLTGMTPTDNGLAPYLSDVYHFSSRPNIGWWTLVMDKCPQPIVGTFPSCAIGEVAWGGPRVPEPATWAMMLAGFGLVGFAARRRRIGRQVMA